MKNKPIYFILIGLMAITLINLLFVAVPVSYAQTSQTWLPPINLSNAGSSTNPALIVDSEETIHVIWADLFEGYKYTKSMDGVNWNTPKVVRFPFSPGFPLMLDDAPKAPLLLADNDGGIHAFWIEASNTLYYSSVSVKGDLDLSSGWTTRTKVADSVASFDVVVSSQGTLHVGYVSNLGRFNNPTGVFYRQRVGNSWAPAISMYSSQYFRSLLPDEANVSLAISEKNNLETIYMAWDDRPQKRILLSKSPDGGNLWESMDEIHGVDGDSGIPYKINVGVVDDNILLLWQSGLVGGQCVQYSLWSSDGGENFSEPVKMLDELAGCPKNSDFLLLDKNNSVISLNIFDDISLMAWNGSIWSGQKTQSEITTFINPATLDNVILGCQKMSVNDGRIFLVGCDIGGGGDVWFSSRSLGIVKDWFPSSAEWTDPIEITNVALQISELSSVSGDMNRVHMFWVQPASIVEPDGAQTIQYARWDGQNWSNPAAVISSLSGSPMQLAVKADHLGRLLLAWIDGKTGEMLFSWASVEQANRPKEWEKPLSIPTGSQINSSPGILVDSTGKIVIIYSVPINENRGIYLVESSDAGKTWSQPLQVFNAVSDSGDIIDKAKISLTGDGRLHVLFSKFSLQGEQRHSLGLYYSQSSDGGLTWREPEEISDKSVPWSEIVGYDKSTLHRLWQEYRKPTLVTFHQISRDSGDTWESPVIVSTINTETSLTNLITDTAGELHFMQISTEDGQYVLRHLIWDGSRWAAQERKEFYNQDHKVFASIAAGVSSDGNLLVSLLANYPYLANELKSGIFSLSKTLELPEEFPSPYLASIPTVEPTVIVPEDISNILQASTPTSPVKGLSFSLSSLLNKNFIGFLLLGGIIIALFVVFRPSIRKKS